MTRMAGPDCTLMRNLINSPTPSNPLLIANLFLVYRKNTRIPLGFPAAARELFCWGGEGGSPILGGISRDFLVFAFIRFSLFFLVSSIDLSIYVSTHLSTSVP